MIVAQIHSFLLHLNDGFELRLGDKDLHFIIMALLGMLLFFAGVCFASACVFTESRFALGVGGGLCAAFLLIRMLGQVSEKLDFLRWLTPTSLFDAYGIAAGDPGALAQTGLLYLGAAALFLAGIWRFSRKDLCL